MKRRIGQGWSAFCKLDNIMRDKNVPMRLKRKVFNECILPVMTYGCETWSLSNTQLEKLVTTQRKMERIMIGVTLKDRKSTEWIRKQSGLTDIIRSIRESKHRWAGHVARRRDNRWTIRITEWIPHGNKRPRGRPRTRWCDDLIQYVGPTWSHIARDRKLWQACREGFLLREERNTLSDDDDDMFLNPTLLLLYCSPSPFFFPPRIPPHTAQIVILSLHLSPLQSSFYLRPVTHTSILSKCFDRETLPKISACTKPNMDEMQFVYLRNRFTDDATVTLIHESLQHLDKGSNSARCLFMDYFSALNTMQPHILINRLQEYNIPARLPLFILDFLTSRKQCVKQIPSSLPLL